MLFLLLLWHHRTEDKRSTTMLEKVFDYIKDHPSCRLFDISGALKESPFAVMVATGELVRRGFVSNTPPILSKENVDGVYYSAIKDSFVDDSESVVARYSNVPPIPPFSEIIEMMYDKSLSFSEDLQVIKVIYNEEKTKRFILLKSVNGYFKYTYEELCVFDDEEWVYICNQENAVPAWWKPMDRSFAYSFFGTEEEAVKTLMQEREYKQYFYKN